MPALEALKEQVKYLSHLMEELNQNSTLAEKIETLEHEYLVEEFLRFR